MNCTVCNFSALDEADIRYIRKELAKPGSDFHARLKRGDRILGRIAIVRDQGEIVGWARTEPWRDWDTLEAFVSGDYRERGIAAFAASGLAAVDSCLGNSPSGVAVFHPVMYVIAAKAGLRPTLFVRGESWVPA